MNQVEPSSNPAASERRSHWAKFAKVLNGRKEPIRGLWIRGRRYYAQLQFEDPQSGETKVRRIPLGSKDQPVESVSDAVAALEALKTDRRRKSLPVMHRVPKFAEYTVKYLESIKGKKKASTIAKESSILDRWKAKIGALRLDQIRRSHINTFIEERIAAKAKPRTINLDVIALRNVLKRARESDQIQRLPTEGLRPLKTSTPKRPLFSTADLEKLCAAAFGTRKNDEGKDAPVTKNAQEFVDYVRLMACCGARRNEALALQWDDVDFDRRQVTIGAAGDTKNRKARVVDFNPRLKKHLLEMKSRREGVSKWLFPSPQRGSKDIPIKTFRESLNLVRTAAGMANFRFHDCRHHFISMCVMSGIDFMTIAAWVGHQDGGVLIGKVYGHLADEHRRRMAGRLTFEPTLFEAAAN